VHKLKCSMTLIFISMVQLVSSKVILNNFKCSMTQMLFLKVNGTCA
jgi:hypothetical protein